MKKIISMILAVSIAVSGIALPTNTANAEETPAATAVPTGTPAVTPTTEPATAPTVKKMRIKVTESKNLFHAYKDGNTFKLTKGFTAKLSLENPDGEYYPKKYKEYSQPERGNMWTVDNETIKEDYKGTVKWTSSKTSVATVSADGTLKAKKTGKSVIKAVYENYTSYVTVKVVKNKFTRDTEPNAEHENGGKSAGKTFCDISSASFDKKGNLSYMYTYRMKCEKSQKKYWTQKYHRIITCGVNEMNKDTYPTVIIKDKDGKIVGQKKKVKIKYWSATVQNPVTHAKFTIDRKYLKKKNIDLRTCTVYIKERTQYHRLIS